MLYHKVKASYHISRFRALLMKIVFVAMLVTNMALANTISYNNKTNDYIIDTDMGPDDWIAISYLLSRKNITIKAITLTGTGAADCTHGVKNVQGLTRLGWPWNIPIACGSNFPLMPTVYHFPISLRYSVNQMFGITLPENPYPPTLLKPSQTMAADLLIQTLKKSPGQVTIVELAPLTNLAIAILKDRSILKKIKMVYMMGGAIYVPGNTTAADSKHYAEANIASDPYAAQVVFQSHVPITLVPLDATRYVPMTSPSLYKKLAGIKTLRGQFIYRVLTKIVSRSDHNNWYFWDPLAAVIATDNSVASFNYLKLYIVTTPDIHQGMTKIGTAGSNVRVALKADRKHFEDILFNTINNYR